MKDLHAFDPVDNEKKGSVKVSTDQEIEKKFFLARTSLKEWKNLDIADRCFFLKEFRKTVLNNLDDILHTLKSDTGKPDVEILMAEIMTTLDFIKYYENNSEKILKKEKRRTPIEFSKNYSYVEYQPYGVVSVISPWNYPFQISLIPSITALVAGNTVILKTSEITPLTGKKIEELIDKAGFPQNVFQVVHGGGEVGEKIIENKPDKIFFTGGVETGKEVMKKASENLIDVELELGGKDPFIVFEDADLDRAVKGVVYGSLANSGQICVSSERVYVERSIKKRFIEKLLEEVKKVDIGDSKTSEMGPMIREEQIELIKNQVDDAVFKGAEMLTEFEHQGNFLKPIVLDQVTNEMDVMRKETFGPVIPVMGFEGVQEAVELANDSVYGLNSSVWTEDVEKGKKIASMLETGNCYINDVVKNIGNPYTPFGGVKKSGIGRYHGPEGLMSFVEPKSVMVNRNKDDELNWFPYTEKLYNSIESMLDIKHGDSGIIEKAKKLFRMAKK